MTCRADRCCRERRSYWAETRGCVFFAVFFAADFFMAARFCAAFLVAINHSSEKVRQRGPIVLLSAPRYRSWSEQKRKAARASSPRRLVLLLSTADYFIPPAAVAAAPDFGAPALG
jgi:hypothetical protein